jgi:hypothetical protein
MPDTATLAAAAGQPLLLDLQRWEDDGGFCPDLECESTISGLNHKPAAPPVYRVLAEHQQTDTAGWKTPGLLVEGWDLQDVITELHDWAETFRSLFCLNIPTVPLRLARLRWNCLGHFNPGFNDFGLRYEIAIDIAHLTYRLETGAWWEVLATLLHEQLHFWQQLNGKPPKPGPGNYHNVQYQGKAAALGLVVSSRGVNEDYLADGPFLQLLRDKGVRVPATATLERDRRPRARVGSKLKKWSCGCGRPVNVRVAVADFQAMCLKCNRLFTPCNPD